MESNQIIKKYKIESETNKGTFYEIVLYKDGFWKCNCPAIKSCKHISKAQKLFAGATTQEIELLVDSPFLKTLRADSSYRLEFNICGDGKEGLPQSEKITKLLSWQQCALEIVVRLKK